MSVGRHIDQRVDLMCLGSCISVACGFSLICVISDIACSRMAFSSSQVNSASLVCWGCYRNCNFCPSLLMINHKKADGAHYVSEIKAFIFVSMTCALSSMKLSFDP